MCDQEQRAEEHKEYLAHKHSGAASLDCDQCNKLLPVNNIEQDWEGTGWNVCEFCIDDAPDFALELIDILKAKVVAAHAMYEALKAVREQYECGLIVDECDVRTKAHVMCDIAKQALALADGK